MHRRCFIHQSFALLPLAISPKLWQRSHPITFGIVADVHKDLMFDAEDRLLSFINDANQRDVDFIIQLGDFCFGDTKNLNFLQIWNSYSGPKFHVLGNHDMDRNSKKEMLAFWNMPSTYYTFEHQGIYGIVLDANFLNKEGKYIDYDHANFYIDDRYRTFIHPDQITWLEDQLDRLPGPCLIFSHQSLWHPAWGVKNRVEIQKILERHAEKIICCLNGHNHIDYHRRLNNINYLEINSMSYHWVADTYKNLDRFPEARYAKTPALANMAVYRDPLYAFATIHDGKMIVEGVQSTWVSPSPSETGMAPAPEGSRCSPVISDYNISLP